MKIGIITEARMTSTRLPGKHMLPVANKLMYQVFIEQLQESKLHDGIVLATTINQADDPLCKLAKSLGVGIYRGNELNVLERVLGAALSFEFDIVVEITADCPLIDPQLIDNAIKVFLENDVDYVSNVINREYADGMDVQVFKTALLRNTYSEALDASHLEHVTTHLRSDPNISKIDLLADDDCYAPDLSITLDTAEDYDKIRRVYTELTEGENFINCSNVTALIR